MADRVTAQEILELSEKWGAHNVEDAMIFLANCKDHKGVLLNIVPTKENIDAVLEAVRDYG